MKPTKSTVYLPVNGPQEKYVISDNDSEYFNGVIEQELFIFTPEQLNEYIQSIIKQTLETAAENAKMCINNGRGLYKEFDIPVGKTREIYTIDEKSILNTAEETYNKLKV